MKVVMLADGLGTRLREERKATLEGPVIQPVFRSA